MGRDLIRKEKEIKNLKERLANFELRAAAVSFFPCADKYQHRNTAYVGGLRQRFGYRHPTSTM